jgi:rubrerythrin
MLPNNLTPVEVMDLAIHGEMLAYRMYDGLCRKVEVPTVLTRLAQLKRDEKDHRKTLRAHRKGLFGSAASTITEEDAARIFGTVDPSLVRDKTSLLQALHAAIRFEEYAAYFYEKMRYKVPCNEARIFFEVLASEGRFHGSILHQQIDALRPLHLSMDAKGRAVEALSPF